MMSSAIKRRAMSGEMMKRVGLWEQHSTTNLNPPTFAASSSPSGSASSSPQHTPQTTPPETTKNPHDSQPKRFPFVQRSVSSTKVRGPWLPVFARTVFGGCHDYVVTMATVNSWLPG